MEETNVWIVFELEVDAWRIGVGGCATGINEGGCGGVEREGWRTIQVDSSICGCVGCFSHHPHPLWVSMNQRGNVKRRPCGGRMCRQKKLIQGRSFGFRKHTRMTGGSIMVGRHHCCCGDGVWWMIQRLGSSRRCGGCG